ncbi:metal-dependent hydrolase [Brassicibacter mesophilus]|uniref:metal-dependent hydrolase n=1 Tax=Brassicibacter mesophilus TaxID=745119 RepID=UPI003D1C7F22
MTGKTHIIVGIAAGLTLATGCSLESGLILTAASAVGSLIPDLDHPRSKINQRVLLFKNKLFKVITYSCMGAGLIYLGNSFEPSINKILRLLGITLILVGISRHRGFTHSLLGLTIFSTIVYIGTSEFNLHEAHIGFIIGYVSHLALDIITTQGIDLLFPSKKNIRLPLGIRTNGTIEQLILATSGIYLGYVLLQYI